MDSLTKIVCGTETLRMLFFRGPVPVTDLKVGNQHALSLLVQEGYAGNRRGYAFLTERGVVAALALGFDADKKSREVLPGFQPVGKLRHELVGHVSGVPIIFARMRGVSDEIWRQLGISATLRWLDWGTQQVDGTWHNSSGRVHAQNATHFVHMPMYEQE